MMKVAFLVSSLRPVGPIRMVFDLAEGLRVLGIASEIFYFDEVEGIPDTQFETTRISFPTGRLPPGYDIVHSHGIRPDTFLYLRRFGRRHRMVSTIHNYVFTDLALLYGRSISECAGRWWLFVWQSFDALACLSHDALDYYKHRRGLADKLFISGNGRAVRTVAIGDDPRHARILAFAARRKVLGTNGALITRKNHETVLRALPGLSEFVFVVAGQGEDEPRLRHLAGEFGVADRVLFLGHQPCAEDLIGCYDVFVLSSLSEGSPLCLIEAAAYGKPIVAPNLPCIHEMFAGGEAVFFDPSSADEFVRAVRQADAQASLLGERARTTYAARLSARAMAERYAAAYSRLQSRDSRARAANEAE